MLKKIVFGTMLTLILTVMLNVVINVSLAFGMRPRVIRLGVWLPRYPADLPPYEDLLASDTQATDVTALNEVTLQDFDAVYVGRGGFWVHTGEGTIDSQAVKDPIWETSKFLEIWEKKEEIA
jgi:hypothetical protein